MSLRRCTSSKNRCSYGSCEQNVELSTLNQKLRLKILKENRIFIPASARFCTQHKREATWNDFQTPMYNYTKEQVEELIELLLDTEKPSEDRNKLSDEMRSNTGLNQSQFDILLSELPTLTATFKNKKIAEIALLAYLKRMRTGHTYDQIRFGLDLSYKTVKKYINAARTSLLCDIVPKHLGFENLSREFLIQNTTEMAKLLCNTDDTLVTIWDGSYVYCNKSLNHELQRRTYSGQKCRNLIKPMVCVTTNGLYVDIFGPFEATQNDATIMEVVFDKYYGPIMNKSKPGDILLLDRGFRDNKAMLTQLGFVLKMPEFVHKDDDTGQLTTDKGNSSRLVTANRFSIEARNGNIKSIFHVFDTRWCAYDLQHFMDDYRIGAALINKFFQSIQPNKNDAAEMAERMLNQVHTPNDLQAIVKSNQFQREIKEFSVGNLEDLEFPKLTEADLKRISLGNYQIKLMSSYCVEHMKYANDQFSFFVWNESKHSIFVRDIIEKKAIVKPTLILVDLHSRFRNRKIYRVYVLADASIDGFEAICGYTCECRHGLRTVGCCGHIMAVIGYLGFLQHNRESLKEVSAFLRDLFEE